MGTSCATQHRSCTENAPRGPIRRACSSCTTDGAPTSSICSAWPMSWTLRDGCTWSRRAGRYGSTAGPAGTGTSCRASASPTRRRSATATSGWRRFHDELWARTGLDPQQTVLGGFSQGSVMSYALGLGPDRPAPAGILVFSGFIPTVPDWEPDLASRQGLPAFIAHGRHDPVMDVAFGRSAAPAARRRRPRRDLPGVRRRPWHRPDGARAGHGVAGRGARAPRRRGLARQSSSSQSRLSGSRSSIASFQRAHRFGLEPGSCTRQAGAPPCGGSGRGGGLGGVDAQVDAVLVQRGDVLGGDEPRAIGGLEDDPVEDVLLGRGDHVIDRSRPVRRPPRSRGRPCREPDRRSADPRPRRQTIAP